MGFYSRMHVDALHGLPIPPNTGYFSSLVAAMFIPGTVCCQLLVRYYCRRVLVRAWSAFSDAPFCFLLTEKFYAAASCCDTAPLSLSTYYVHGHDHGLSELARHRRQQFGRVSVEILRSDPAFQDPGTPGPVCLLRKQRACYILLQSILQQQQQQQQRQQQRHAS